MRRNAILLALLASASIRCAEGDSLMDAGPPDTGIADAGALDSGVETQIPTPPMTIAAEWPDTEPNDTPEQAVPVGGGHVDGLVGRGRRLVAEAHRADQALGDPHARAGLHPHRVVPVARQADQHGADSLVSGIRGGGPMQVDFGFTVGPAQDFDVRPVGVRPDAGPEGFGDRLFRGETGRIMAVGVLVGTAVGLLAFGEDPVQEAFTEARDGVRDALCLNQIDADAVDFHECKWGGNYWRSALAMSRVKTTRRAPQTSTKKTASARAAHQRRLPRGTRPRSSLR